MPEPLSQPEWPLESTLPEPLPEPLAENAPIRVTIPAEEPSLPPPEAAELPGLVDTVLFFLLAVFIVFVGELGVFALGRQLPVFRHESFAELASDPRLMMPAQAVPYLALLGLATLLFGALWHRPFWKAIHWNASTTPRRWLPLIGVGIVLGLASTVGGNYLPMPKEAPILNDLMHSTMGAWLMFLFGTTGAPLVEELAFRGFLLPSLVNFLRGRERRGAVSPALAKWFGVPLAILLTSAPFALLHSLQVSNAWAPLLLIGMVSIALCAVRLWTNSLAASTLVHATYNFCLFAGMMVASDGFRHLEKLNN